MACPKNDKIRLKLFERLLEGSMLGGQMAGGGIGVAPKEELILMHCVLDMGLGVDANALRRFAPLFVETVEKWREIVRQNLRRRRAGAVPIPRSAISRHQPSQMTSGKPGGFIKI